MPDANTNRSHRDLVTEPAQPPRDRMTELESENRRIKDTIRSLQHENITMGRELQEYKNLSEIRGRELLGTQVFLRKADYLSISDVKDKVNALNGKNFQASTSLGESLVHFKWELAKEEREAAFAQVCRAVSEPFARALMMETQKPEPEVNPLLVQVVLEMYLVHFCFSMIEPWFLGSRETSDFLATIYNEVRRAEAQSVSGRWRALTRAQIRPTSATWRDEFMMGLGNIFQIAEWTFGSQDNLNAFEQKLPAIFKAIEDLRVALGVKVTSIDLEVNVASPNAVFNHRWMEDGYGDARQGNTKKSGEFIAGTTGIGLKKVLPSPSGEEMFENVLSPKVVLVSTLQEALLPPPPLPSRLNKRGQGPEEPGQEGRGRSSSSKAPPPVKEVITTTPHSRSDTLGLTKNPTTAVGNEHKPLSAGRVIVASNTIPSDRPHDLGLAPATATDEERESLLAARAIVDGSGAAPVMAIIDAILAMRREITKVSNFLAENIRHSSYELFQEELDRCYQESEEMLGERLSKFLHERSEAQQLSKLLITMTIQIFIVSFCASEWEHYLDTVLDVATGRNTPKNRKERKVAFLRNIISVFKIAAWVVPGSTNRAAFEESLNPFFTSMEETETAWKQLPGFTKVTLSVFSPGEDLGDETYAKDATKSEIQISNALPAQNIVQTVLGTTAFGVRCRFQDRITGVVDEKPRTLLTAKGIFESNLPSIFAVQEERKPTTIFSQSSISSKRTAQREDGRDP